MDALCQASTENFVDDVMRPPMTALVRGAGTSKQTAPSQGPGLRQEIFALDEGDVVITFPEELSAESYSELAAYLDLFKKKMRRRSGAPSETLSGEAGSDPSKG